MTVEDRDIHIDFAGSSPQSQRGINVVFNYTHAYASFAMKAAVSPEVPHNEGAFRPVHVSAPPGSIFNCLPPAAVASRHILGHFLPGVIFGALAEAFPLMAAGSDPIWISVFRGRPPEKNGLFTFSLFQCGGGGARAGKDGLSATGFPSGVAGVPAEAVETLSSLVQYRRELRPDSGGPGRYRGGLGQYTEMGCRTEETWTVSAMVDRIRHPPEGILGGLPGARGELLIDGQDEGRPKALLALQPDQRVQLNLPGGGGFGDPLERDPQTVLADVVEGYVSVTGAERDYGVVVRYTGAPDQKVRLPQDYELDTVATERLRAGRRKSV